MKQTEHTQMGSVERNMGFIFNSRLLDALITVACIAMATLGFYMNDDMIVAYAVPAAIGIFRQFVALLTFPYVVSIGIATLLMGLSLPMLEGMF